MKKILITLIMVGNSLYSQPTNRFKTHFGVKEAFLKTNIGYYSNPYKTNTSEHQYGYLGNSEAGMLTNSIINIELGVMVNNLYLEKDEKMIRPKFLIGNIYSNFFQNSQIYSFSYGQLTECQWKLFNYKRMKAIWSVGPSYRELKIDQNYQDFGLRFGFGGYSREYGIKSEIFFFKNNPLMCNEVRFVTKNKNIITNISINKKIYKNILFEFGTEYNYPKVGVSYIYKVVKLNLTTIKYRNKLSYGSTLTLSL